MSQMPSNIVYEDSNMKQKMERSFSRVSQDELGSLINIRKPSKLEIQPILISNGSKTKITEVKVVVTEVVKQEPCVFQTPSSNFVVRKAIIN